MNDSDGGGAGICSDNWVDAFFSFRRLFSRTVSLHHLDNMAFKKITSTLQVAKRIIAKKCDYINRRHRVFHISRI